MKKALSIILALVLLFSLAACAAPVEPEDPNDTVDENIVSSKDTLVIRMNSDTGTLDTRSSIHNNTFALRSFATNYLVSQYQDETGAVSFDIDDESLAEKYEFDEDDMGITFYLRQGVLFQNGKEMTADDVVFSIKQQAPLAALNFIDFDNVSAVDTYTVHVPLIVPSSSVMMIFGTNVPVWCASYYEELGGKDSEADFYSSKAIGTGAFKITEWVSDDYVMFERNDSYFAGVAKIKYIKVRFISDASIAMLELEAGGVDYLLDPDGNDVNNVLLGNYGDDISVSQASNETAVLFGFNLAGKLADKTLREAICYAIDKEEFTIGAYEFAGTDLYCALSNYSGDLNDYSANWPYPHDVEKAKQLLSEAGYDESNPLHIIIVVGSQATQRTGCEILASQFEKAGIELEIQMYDTATYSDITANQTDTWDVYLRNANGTIHPQGFTGIVGVTLPQNGHYENDENYAEYIERINVIKTTLDIETRDTLWGELQDDLLTEYLYWYPMVQLSDNALYASNLNNLNRTGYKAWKLLDAYFA